MVLLYFLPGERFKLSLSTFSNMAKWHVDTVFTITVISVSIFFRVKVAAANWRRGNLPRALFFSSRTYTHPRGSLKNRYCKMHALRHRRIVYSSDDSFPDKGVLDLLKCPHKKRAPGAKVKPYEAGTAKYLTVAEYNAGIFPNSHGGIFDAVGTKINPLKVGLLRMRKVSQREWIGQE